MTKSPKELWGQNTMPPLESPPFQLARSTCRHAVEVAQDVTVVETEQVRFVDRLDVSAVQKVMQGSMGENCDTLPDDFRHGEDAANFALLFCLMQFGHGYRYALHRCCQRGASRTITVGIRSLQDTGPLSAERLSRLTEHDVQQAFQLPDDAELTPLVDQLFFVLHHAATVLQELGMTDFAGFCHNVLADSDARQSPAETLVWQLARHFAAFNDQGELHDGSRVVLLKKATLAAGELHRLAAPHDQRYDLSKDLRQAVATIDNVIPAMLVYHGILHLSPELHGIIHQHRAPLPRGPMEAELRAVALDVCEQIVAAADHEFTALDIGYYLWLSGKTPGARQFSRHHTPDTVFY